MCDHTFAVASQEYGEESVLNGATPNAWLDECLIGAGLVEEGCANYDEILRCTIQGESVDDFDTCRALCISR